MLTVSVRALDASVSINMFWRDLDETMYDSKDVYGNRDLKIGQAVLETVRGLDEELDRLPSYYRSFYRLRALHLLQQQPR